MFVCKALRGLVVVLSVTWLATAARAQTPWSDDFEDGVIDPNLWVLEGRTTGGGWSYSFQEVVATDGHLEANVQGPATANTYGAEALVRTAYDFNDGNDWVINFTWDARRNAYHQDSFVIAIGDGYFPPAGVPDGWPWEDLPCRRLLWGVFNSGGTEWYVQDGERVEHPGAYNDPAFPVFQGSKVYDGPVHWSIVIDSSEQTATLYFGPSGTGEVHASRPLDAGCPWYIRFFLSDYTSAGFPAGDNSLYFYSFTAVPGPAKAAALDIKPGSCPNPFNRNSRGVLPVGLLGTGSFDVAQVDVFSILLSRADGVGGSVAPLAGPPGPHSVFADVGTPFDGELCDCHELSGDGIDDLSLKFKTQDVVDELELNSLGAGAEVELIVSGTLLDGTPFEALDCIEIVPAPGVGAVNVSVGSNQPDTYIEVTPSDATTDDSGFTPFDRCYENGTTVTLTAPASSNRRVFAGWRVNGVFQATSQRSIQAVVDGIVSLEAVYGSRRSSRLPVAAYDE